jgi:hypothetical protein
MDFKAILSISLVYKYNFISQLGTKIFVIYKQSIDKHVELGYL